LSAWIGFLSSAKRKARTGVIGGEYPRGGVGDFVCRLGYSPDFASPGLLPCDAACCIKSSSSFQNSILPGILLTV
jgi:hypothetical protein